MVGGASIIVKDIELRNLRIRWVINPEIIDFGMYVYLKQEPPVLIRLYLEYVEGMLYEKDPPHAPEGYDGGSFYIGDGTVLVNLGCTIPSSDEELKKNLEIINKNKDGLMKIYEGIWGDLIKKIKNIDEKWDKLVELDRELRNYIGGKE